MPPLFKCRGVVNVFVQNVNILSLPDLKTYPLRVQLRILMEYVLFRSFQFRLNAFFVQTLSV